MNLIFFHRLLRCLGTLDPNPGTFARYTLDPLPNKVMAREYQLALPELKPHAVEFSAVRRRLKRAGRKRWAF